MLPQSYVADRNHRVVLNGYTFKIHSGVPQGSVLGPLLFLVFINDLETEIVSHVKFVVDDKLLFSVVNDQHTTSITLSQDLLRVQNWAQQWKMCFKPDPDKQAVELLFSPRKTQLYNIHPSTSKIYMCINKKDINI